jgi:hypothetical protein
LEWERIGSDGRSSQREHVKYYKEGVGNPRGNNNSGGRRRGSESAAVAGGKKEIHRRIQMGPSGADRRRPFAGPFGEGGRGELQLLLVDTQSKHVHPTVYRPHSYILQSFYYDSFVDKQAMSFTNTSHSIS